MIVAGFGFRTGATQDSLIGALEQVSTDYAVDVIAAPADKVEGVFSRFARQQGLPIRRVSELELTHTTTTTQSTQSLAHRGTGSVAEACALAAAGPGARLIVSRQISPDRFATCAIAIGTDT